MNNHYWAVYFFFIFLMTVGSEPPVSVITAPPGLANCKNTCFANASLQLLFVIPELVSVLATAPENIYQKTEKLKTTAGYFTDLIKETLVHQGRYNATKKPHHYPSFKCDKYLKELINSAYLDFFNISPDACKQQDADEFIGFLINQMIQFYPKVNPIIKTTIVSLFFGKLKSTISCPPITIGNLQYPAYITPVTEESSFIKLDVPIPQSEKLLTLQDTLFYYAAKEQLSDFKNPLTNQRQSNCTKQISIIEPPFYLFIKLSRYKVESSLTIRKNEEAVMIPEIVDLKPYIATAEKNKLYELIGVIIHSGVARGGHYWAYVKYPSGWYKCDDAIITRIGAGLQPKDWQDINGTGQDTNKPTGYIFLYKKIR